MFRMFVQAKTNYMPLKVLSLSLLSAYAIPIGYFLMGAANTEAPSFHPMTFHTLYLLFALIGIGITVWKLKVKCINFILVCMFGAITSAGLWLLVPDQLQERIVPKAQYYGVQSRITLATHDAGPMGTNTAYDYNANTWGLYPDWCPLYKQEAADLASWNESVSVRPFYTWQAGMAAGFNPDLSCRGAYDLPSGLIEHLTLYVSVGPVLLLELLIEALVYFLLPIFLLQIGWYVYRRCQVWWD